MGVLVMLGILVLVYFLGWTWMQYEQCRNQAEDELYQKSSQAEKDRWLLEFRERVKEREAKERGMRSCENPVGKIIEDWFW